MFIGIISSSQRRGSVSGGGGGGVFSDDFNRADGALGANWVIQVGSNMAISSNEVRTTTTSADQLAHYNSSFNNNQYSEMTVTAGNGEFPGVCVRCAGASPNHNAYFVNRNGIQKFVNGSYSLIKAGDWNIVNGDRIRVEVEGTAIRSYKNDVLFDSTTDSSLSSGAPGFIEYTTSAAVTMDDWEGGNL